MTFIWARLVVAAHLLTVCLGQTDESQFGASLSLVTKECNTKLTQINSLESFNEFMKHYRIVTRASAKPKKGLLNLESKLRKCYDNKEELFELEDLINSQGESVCSQSYLKKLVDYHLKYVVKKSKDRDDTATIGDVQTKPSGSYSSSVKTNYSARLFSLFAHQVTYTCKKQLLLRIESIQQELDCSSVLSSFLPPDVVRTVESTTTSSDGDRGSDQKLDEFSSFLQNFKRVEDFAIIGEQISPVGAYYDVVVSRDVLERIERLKTQCRAREPYYSAVFAPIATLSQLGYDVEEASVDSTSLEDRKARLLKCWLATAQLCQGILRTHLTPDEQDGNSDSATEDVHQKLVKIKFGQVPRDVAPETSEQSRSSRTVLNFKDSVSEITKNVIDLVNKKASLKSKIKRRVLNWARQFVVRNIDIDGRQSEMAHAFMGALTREEGETDSAVAFNGKQRSHGAYKPASLITDDADSITQAVSMFVQKEIALIFSSAVAICLSAVFVWFTLYALISSMRATNAPESGDNFKANWREMRDKRMKALDDKVKNKGWKGKLMVYRSPTNK